MKKSILLAFGLLIATFAAYSIPNDFKELKVKPVFEKVFSVEQESPAIIVDEINIVTQGNLGDICNFTYDIAMIKNEEIKITMHAGYGWRRLSRSGVNKHVDKKASEVFINRLYQPQRTE